MERQNKNTIVQCRRVKPNPSSAIGRLAHASLPRGIEAMYGVSAPGDPLLLVICVPPLSRPKAEYQQRRLRPGPATSFAGVQSCSAPYRMDLFSRCGMPVQRPHPDNLHSRAMGGHSRPDMTARSALTSAIGVADVRFRPEADARRGSHARPSALS